MDPGGSNPPEEPMPKSFTRLRARLLRKNPRCWFCGMGFPPEHITLPADDSPDGKREREHAEPTVEHLLPRSRGGTSRRDNLVLAHRFCNNMAADKTPEEKLAIRKRLLAALAEVIATERVVTPA
jgi:5-methylcytosine-specific restriction endonuclease McrA